MLPEKQITTAVQKILVFENNDVNLSKKEDEPQGILDYLTLDGVDIDELIRLSGKDPQAIALELLELELQGLAERRPGNKIALTAQN